MNVQLPVRMDKAAFLDWVQGREERYELDRGRVIMMTGGHGHIGGLRETCPGFWRVASTRKNGRSSRNSASTLRIRFDIPMSLWMPLPKLPRI